MKGRMARRYMPKSLDELAQWYMRYISPLALIAGFFADNLILLRRVDVWTSNALLFSYLALAAVSIVVLNLITTGRIRARWVLTVTPLIPVVTQFAFGGLFSGYLSLYSRSASFPLTWVFVVIVAALLLGNERFVRQYMKFSFQVSMFFTVLFSFFIFFLPVVFHRIGPWMFVGSGVASLAVMALFLRPLFLAMPELLKQRTRIARTIAVIFVVFNILYFSNAIPPLPLALKAAGVYHSVERRQDNLFYLGGEAAPWYGKYLPYGTVFHHAPGQVAYAFSAVFAPTGISTVILHEWQRYDAATDTWLTHATVRYPIIGGRDGGYRGYSYIKDISEGKWRVNVITQYGQIIGRMSFTVVDVPTPVAVVERQN
ncbi:hypothetical protein A2680_04005 [Candidatus Kaiserbacteria bacterium RIFCSPHIGHO2_01_FULL_55_37]|nr:MAG: hypothetical protein A2680_04005 [Candidatus Kaiserbacteria bacterium RIFCSPHIGHO2_01_FULL_55_37]